ncbi:MAG: S8 family serine peptidase, partial [Phycicoccus sp.]
MAIAAVATATVATSASAATPDPKQLPQSPRAESATDPVKSDRADRLGQHDRELLEKARDKRASRVTMLIATERDRTEGVADAVKAAGGKVVTRNDRVGYVRASVPTARVEKISGAAKVLAVDLDESIQRPDPSAEAAARKSNRTAAAAEGPGAATPLENPYMPIGETGSVEFRADHPEWDGRGVTIGVIDSGVDLDHPALQTTSTGERKITDWVTSTDPIFDGDATWRAMLTDVTGPSFSYQGSTWTAPAGTYKVNRFSESITAASEPAGDVNRDGDTTDQFGVLYDPVSHDIWVDADQDRSFETTELMRPYKEKYDIRHFGTDDPATDIVERMPFVVEFREDVDVTPAGLTGVADFVNIGIVEDAHG